MAGLAPIALLVHRTWRAAPASVLQEIGVFAAISTGVYFMFGPLIHPFGPVDASEYSRSWYPISAGDAVRLTGMNFVGFGLAGLVYELTRFCFVERFAERVSRSWSQVSPTVVFLMFAVVGATAKYALVLPFDLALTLNAPSGIIRQLDNLIVIAIMVGWANRKSGPLWIGLAAIVLLLLEVATGLLQFNKNASLLALMAAGLGDYLATRRLRNLIVAGLTASALYGVIAPIVTFGRAELAARRGGEPSPAGLLERRDIVLRFYQGGESATSDDPIPSGWWVRLCYLSPQQAAIDMYDCGLGGDDFARLPWIVMPRFLYPEKPEMTISGVDFNEKVAGIRTTSTGTGVFIDGYYNLGWLGFLFTSISFGMALRVYANIAKPVLKNRAFIMFPLVFKAIHVALRVDGWWLADVAGTLVFVLAALTLMGMSSRWRILVAPAGSPHRAGARG
ncbi:MAG: hypothetical protein AAB074_17270 [Planctomycetota bacterium]